jgi:hypothetical protein
MNIHKKNVFGFFLALLVLFFVGYSVIAGLDTTNTNVILGRPSLNGSSNATLYREGTELSLNFTIRWTGSGNITMVNITTNPGNYTFNGFISGEAGNESGNGVPGTTPRISAATAYLNNTYNLTGDGLANWGCYNLTSSQIICVNRTAATALHAHNLQGIIIRANFTVMINSIEEVLDSFNITTYDSANAKSGVLVHNNIYVDNLKPRITSLNITDGNYTLINGTNYGINVNGINEAGQRFTTSNSLVVTATITEVALDKSPVLWHWANKTSGIKAYPLQGGCTGGQGRISGTWAGEGSSRNAVYQWTIPTAGLVEGNTTVFVVLANDTLNHNMTFNAYAVNSRPFNITINNTIPKILRWNMTDGTNWVSNANGHLQENGKTFTIYVDVGTGLRWTQTLGDNSMRDNVRVFYSNNTNTGKAVWNETIIANGREVVNITNRGLVEVPLSNITAFTQYGTNTFKATIANTELNMSTGSVFSFFIIAEPDEIEYNYTAVQAGIRNQGFNITFDDTAPTMSSLTTTDLDAIIAPLESITYTCVASDNLRGVGSVVYMFKMAKPGQNEDTASITTSYSGTSTHTFTNTDTNEAGGYTVWCYAKDAVSNRGTLSKTFTVQHGGSGSTSSGGGGGGSSAAVIATVDVDLTKTTSNKMTVAQGSSKKFTLDGTTSHKLTVNKVTATSVQITLMSTPVTLELFTGDSKLVDLDGDGDNDVKVTLNKITGSNADITIEKLVAATPTTPAKRTGTKETGGEQETGVVGSEEQVTAEGRSSSWVWWVLGLVIVLGFVYFAFVKKR